MEERQKVDALKFKEAGMGPIQKTYAYNPKAISAKSADKRKWNEMSFISELELKAFIVFCT